MNYVNFNAEVVLEMPENHYHRSNSDNNGPQSLRILGIPVHMVTTTEVIELVREFMKKPRLHQIATVNPEFVMAAQEDGEFCRVLMEADLCIPDGVGLLLAGRWLGQPLPERVAGSTLVYLLAELSADEGWRLFLLGSAPGVAAEAGHKLQMKYPKLEIAGTFAGSPEPKENEAIVQMINDSQADMLFVAYGAPKQDKWIARNRSALTTVRVAMGIGGSLDFITGRAVRAPQWVQNVGLEWLHRLYKEPWRWRRMASLPKFALKVMRDA